MVIFENTLFSKIALNTSLHPRLWGYSQKYRSNFDRTHEIRRSIQVRLIFRESVHSRLDRSQTCLDRSQTRLDRSQTCLDPSQFNFWSKKKNQIFLLVSDIHMTKLSYMKKSINSIKIIYTTENPDSISSRLN